MKASRAILWLALASVAVTVLATDPAPADIDAGVQRNRGNNHHHKYGSYGEDHEEDKSRVITLKVLNYFEQHHNRVGNVTAKDTEQDRNGGPNNNHPGEHHYWSEVTCGARRGTNEKGGHATESHKPGSDSPKINWNIQDVDIIGGLSLETRLGHGFSHRGSQGGDMPKPVMIGNAPAWQIGEVEGSFYFGDKDKRSGRDNFFTDASKCDPLLDDAWLSFGKSKGGFTKDSDRTRSVPVYAMIAKASIPADFSLLHGAQSGAHQVHTSSESETPLQHRLFGSAPCGIAIVAKGDAKLKSGGDKYTGTVQATLAWSNMLLTLPGGFSTAHPFLEGSFLGRGKGGLDGIINFATDGLSHVLEAGQLWAMCNDAVPVSSPGEITVSLKMEDKQKWDAKEDGEEN